MKLKIDKKVDDDSAGILYVLEMHIDGTVVYKIGVTKRKIEERVVEILGSFFNKYRYFCYVKPRKFSKTSDVYKKESLLHRHFKDYRYESEHVWSGNTEVFYNLELDVILNAYALVLSGGQPDELEVREGSV